MARTKISTVAKDLNIGLSTAVEFLRKKNIEIEDNPNARVEDDIVALLTQEFQRDRAEKSKSDTFLSERRSAAKTTVAPAPEPELIKVETPVNTPKILGKINLDAKGNRIDSTPKPQEKPVAPKHEPKPEPEKKAEPQPVPVKEEPKKQPEKVELPKEEKIVVEPKEEKKSEPETIEKPVVEKADIEKPIVEKPTEEKKEATPATPEPKAEKPHSAETQTETTSNGDDAEGVYTIRDKNVGVNIKVVGTVDLDALNQSMRPKKKGKEERRGAKGEQGGTGNSERKKRKRIGKEKIDIEKTPGTNEPTSRSGKNNGGRSEKPSKNKRQHTVEVSEEDVQKQVKETLARLTNKDKGQKKAAKWRKEKREAFASREREAAEMADAESRTLKLTEFVTANDLASMMNVPINQVISTCMNLGVMVSINQRLDAETINIVAEEFGYTTEYVSAEVVEAIQQSEDTEEELRSRPPIVTVMGHVDHGKTSLLDYIRNANVIAGEAGGITQHIGAYHVTLKDGRHITFLDTPGHEAFTAMRARGAKVTDLCIIIVAADDNVMPQTIEAINHASAAGVPMVFAINKIDKPAANPEKIKEELAGMNYLVEEWGGKYQSQDISAKKGIGVEELMEKVLLEAEMLDLKANPDRPATGSIIESSLDKGRGYIATVLVQNGTLRVGDIILAGTHYGKIKAMFNERNQRIKEAGPAEPALILGLNGAPTAGDTFNVLETEQEAREIANKREQLQRELGLRTKKILTLEDIGRRRAIGNFQELNIIVKGDVDGSIEALSDSLLKLSTEEIQVNVIHKAVGEISESDVTLAAASDAIIVGFQVRPSIAARRAAEREGVEIRLYSVIYQAIEEVKDAMAGMLAPEVKEEVTGTAEVMETYHISKVGTIAGALVREGKIKRGSKVRLIRDGIVRYTGELGSLKRFKDDVKEVSSGYDCGLSIQGYNDIKVGDLIEGFNEVEVNRTL